MKQHAGLISGLTAMVLMAFSATCAQATTTGDSVEYAFKGHLVTSDTSCKVNDDQAISIPFGNVSIRKVASGQYMQNINYTLDCGTGTKWSVTMTLKATPTDWDTQAMASSVSGLGVRILNAGTPVDLNTAIAIDLNNPPVLQAQLVSEQGVQLTEQPFTAGGTLIASYQ
jgi:type 1 fimbria pilin